MKIIVSDFDQTFYTKDFKENIKAINKWTKDGNLFVIATGRNIHSLNSVIKDYHIKYSYLICNDGGVIFDKDMHQVYRKDIDLNVFKLVYDYFKEYFTEVYIDNGYQLTYFSEEANGVIARYTDKLSAIKHLDYIKKIFPTVGGYISDNYINATHVSVNKASAIKLLFNETDIYVIGDKDNDIPMFKDYYGISLNNSINELKELSKEQVKDFKEALDIIKKRP